MNRVKSAILEVDSILSGGSDVGEVHLLSVFSVWRVTMPRVSRVSRADWILALLREAFLKCWAIVSIVHSPPWVHYSARSVSKSTVARLRVA